MIQRIISGDHTFMKKTALPLIWKSGVKRVRVKEFLDNIMDIIFDATDEQFNKFDESIKKINGTYSIEKF